MREVAKHVQLGHCSSSVLIVSLQPITTRKKSEDTFDKRIREENKAFLSWKKKLEIFLVSFPDIGIFYSTDDAWTQPIRFQEHFVTANQ